MRRIPVIVLSSSGDSADVKAVYRTFRTCLIC